MKVLRMTCKMPHIQLVRAASSKLAVPPPQPRQLEQEVGTFIVWFRFIGEKAKG